MPKVLIVKTNSDQGGFSPVEAVLVLGLLVAMAIVGWYVLSNRDLSTEPEPTMQAVVDSSQLDGGPTPVSSNVGWSFVGDKWVASGEAPECPAEPYLQTPTDLSKVTGILYPGQYRGDDYKSHGGFRFDNNKSQDIDVTIPIDAKLIAASRYTSALVDGEAQYFMIFIAPCGIMIRFDHITKFTDKFQKILDTLPPAKVDDSRTTNFSPAIDVKAGELIGTEIGFPGNVFFDFGISDLRSPNEPSKDPSYAAEHENSKQYSLYGVCWFDLLPTADASIVKALPAGGKEGKVSDYCL